MNSVLNKTCDDSLSNFNEYVNNYESYKAQDLSESDTRSKLIDGLLKNVLGWNESDILREGHGDSGFYDYNDNDESFNSQKQYEKKN